MEIQELQLKNIELLLLRIDERLNTRQTQVIPALCTIEQAAILKGGPNPDQYKKKLYLQPCCGTHYKKQGGRKVWPKEIVIEWLSVTDEDLPRYAAKYGVNISKYLSKKGRKK